MGPTPRFSIRVDPAELEKWKQAAKSEGVSVAELIHKRMGATKPKCKPTTNPVKRRFTDERPVELTNEKPTFAHATGTPVVCPPHPKAARTVVNAGLGLYHCGACGDNYRS